MRAILLMFLMLLSSGFMLRAERGTHEWVLRGPGGLYGLIQYDWIQSTSEDRVWPISEVTWPISRATHKVRSYTIVYFAQYRFSLPLSAPAVVCLVAGGFGVVVFVTVKYVRKRYRKRVHGLTA